ncbi:MAG: homoserine kinase [Candidatus Rokubacteria bacterium]|nr:homoserine kinase [Candidatus Rokubacteria bacterium]
MRVRVRVPATSANLGPGFDVLGLALGLHNEMAFEESEGVAVSIEGEGAGRLATGEDNVVVKGARMAFQAAGRPWRGVTLHCVNRIPPSRGLGSSAAAWVGGLVGGNALCGAPLDRDALLRLAARAEGHPDNVTAALLGGLTVSCWAGDRVAAASLPVPADLCWVVLVPEAEGCTAEARAALPESYPRADAVFNLQRVSLLVAALATGKSDLLGVAMEDRLHQPFRLKLFPWLAGVLPAAVHAGALACALSGAGPSVLAVARGPGDDVGRAMEGALRRAGVAGRALALAADTTGTSVEQVAR